MYGSTSKWLSLVCTQFVGICWITSTMRIAPHRELFEGTNWRRKSAWSCYLVFRINKIFLLWNLLWTILNFEFLSVLWQTKNIELNHDDALVEPNVEPSACWFNNQTDCASPALQRRSTSCIRHRILSSRPRKYQNPRQLITQSRLRCHTSIMRSCTFGPI